MTKGKNNKQILRAGIVAFFSFCSGFCTGQRIETVTDRKEILIGEQFLYNVKASFPAGSFTVHWFNMPDSIPHFELVEKSRVDSSSENGNTILQQTVTLTSFDSGRWKTPGFLISFDPVKDDTTINLFTDSVAVNVSYSAPDSTNELRDIKPIIQVAVKDYTWYYIIGAAVLLLLLVFLLYRYFKKKKKPQPGESLSKLSPYDEAMEELSKLAGYDLRNAGELKLYHSKLSAIFKNYLGRRQRKNLLTRTTGDLLIRMTESGMTADHVSDLARALRCTDAVKFAKYMPAVAESEDSLQRVKAAISLLEHQTSNLSAGALTKGDTKQ